MQGLIHTQHIILYIWLVYDTCYFCYVILSSTLKSLVHISQ